MGRRSMRPDSESLCAQWRWFLIRLLILIGILYLLFGCIFGITTVKNEDMAASLAILSKRLAEILNSEK